MDLKSPTTLLSAWLLAPLVTVIAAGGLGLALSAASGWRLGPMTVPLGYMAGIVLMVGLLELGLDGDAAVVIAAVLALTGYAASGRAIARARTGWGTSVRAAAPAVLAAVAGFLLAMAPLVGSGRAGVLGYVLNDDSAVHASLVELLRDHGANPAGFDSIASSTIIADLARSGYPLGTHVWPLFSGTFSSLDAFYVWTPSIAVAAAMLSLVAFVALRRLDLPSWPAAIAGALVPAGYLFFSFIAQGAAKEVITAVAVYGAIVIAAELFEDGPSLRASPLFALAPLAALLTFGVGAAAWLAIPVLVFALLALRRRRELRLDRRVAAAGVLFFIVVGIGTTALVGEALDYVRRAEEAVGEGSRQGNLLGAVPWEQALNLWFAYDFRADPPTYETLSAIAPWLAALFAVGGLAYAVYRRQLVIPLIVLAGVVAAIVISQRYPIYLEAKAYAVLSPALAIAVAAGALALMRASRFVGAVLAVALAAGVLGGAALVYAGAWVTPKERFEDLVAIEQRFEAQGPILINERESWAKHLLRDLEPTDWYDAWELARGLRTGDRPPPALPHVPDFDDYRLRFLERFPLLLERRTPGGSRPQVNYEQVYETAHYRVWQRRGEGPRVHLPLGDDAFDHAVRLDCAQRRVRALFAAARRSRSAVAAALPAAEPSLIIGPDAWRAHTAAEAPSPPGFVNRRGGSASVSAQLSPGRYTAWLQGSFGPGLGLVVGGAPAGAAFGDLGLPSAWHRLGEVDVASRDIGISLESLSKPWWHSGSKRSDITGPLVFVPDSSSSRIVETGPSKARALCGRRLDWVELSRD